MTKIEKGFYKGEYLGVEFSVSQSNKTEYYTYSGVSRDSARSRVDRSWTVSFKDGKKLEGIGTKNQAVSIAKQSIENSK